MSFQSTREKSMFTLLFSIQWKRVKTVKAVKFRKTKRKHNKSIKSSPFNLCTIFQVFWNTVSYFCDSTQVIWTISYVLFFVFRPWQLQSPSAFIRWGKTNIKHSAKYIFVLPTKEKNRFWATWKWINYCIYYYYLFIICIFNFGWTVSLNDLLKKSQF